MINARHRALLVLLLTLVLGVAAVSAASEAAARAKPTVKIKTVHVGGKTKHVAVARGKQVRIELSTSSDGGYAWAVSRKPSRAVAKIGTSRVVPSANGAPGAPSRTYYRITAKGYGKTTVTLVERRPFDRSDVARRVTITIVVPRYPAFYGNWSGHTRYLYIGRTGRGTEHVGDGCCDPLIDLSFQLSHPRTVNGSKVATATVVGVDVHKGWQDTGRRAPRVGDTGTVRLRNGVLTERISDTYYCNAKQSAKGTCGA